MARIIQEVLNALKGHGFSRAVTWAWRVGLQPRRELALRLIFLEQQLGAYC